MITIRPDPSRSTADLVNRCCDTVDVRPVEPIDEALLAEFFDHVSLNDLNFRLLSCSIMSSATRRLLALR